MKKLTKVIMSGAAVAALGCTMAFGFAACGNGGDEGELRGTITIEGSTSVQPLMGKLADAFMEEHEGVTVQVGGGGSGVGISKAKDGTVDLGMASEAVDEDGVTPIQIANDGIALIVSANCSISEVVKQDVYELYVNHTAIDGVITDAISRDSSSGTRSAFQELIGIKAAGTSIYDGQPQLNSQDLLITQVAAANNVMGYCSLEALAVNTTIKGLLYKADENATAVAPTTENVKNGSYTLSRPFNIIYNTSKGMNEITQAFVDFIFSADGAAIIEANGQVTVERK